MSSDRAVSPSRTDERSKGRGIPRRRKRRVGDPVPDFREEQIRRNLGPAFSESASLRTRAEEAWCCGCLAWLPLDAFRPNPGSRSGVQSRCRRCRSEASRQWRQQNAEHVARYNAARRIGARERECVECGTSFIAGLRGPASTRCPGCRRQRKIELRRALRGAAKDE
jgi:hypothetical protein